MKATLILLFIICSIRINAQVITYDNFRNIIPDLQSENWKAAYEKASNLLENTTNDSSDIRGIVSYIVIYAAAGMVSSGQFTHDKFLKIANKYIGQQLLMSAHPFADSSKIALNSTTLKNKETGSEGSTAATNAKGTSIFCFENFKFADRINPQEFAGSNIRCGGRLDSVQVNPNKSTIWISRLYISNAFVRKVNP